MPDWKDIADDREKYAAYLCSREWSELKRLVHARAGGTCERCRRNTIHAVHHLTYVRKYAERLEDLQAICNPCHEFIHGLRDSDVPQEETVYVDRDWLLAFIHTTQRRADATEANSLRKFLSDSVVTLRGFLGADTGNLVAVTGRLGWLRMIGVVRV